MARIAGVPEDRGGWLSWLAYRFSRKRLGKVAEPLAVSAHHPWIMRGLVAYEFALDRSRRIDPRLKALAGLKAATLVGCPF